MQTANLQHSSDGDDMEHIEVVDDVTLNSGGASSTGRLPYADHSLAVSRAPHITDSCKNEPGSLDDAISNSLNTHCLSHKEDRIDHFDDVGQAGLQAESEDNLDENGKYIATTPLVRKRPVSNPLNKKFGCDVCSMRCRNSYLLELHKCMHSEERPYACNDCDLTFKHPSHLRRHEKKHTGNVLKEAAQNSNNIDVSNRPQTPFSEFGEEPISSVCDRSTVGDIWSCLFCQQSFHSQHSLLRHERNHTNPLACGVCDKVFASAAAFQLHRNTHAVHLPYGCSACDAKFRRKMELDQHREECHQLAPGEQHNDSNQSIHPRRTRSHGVSGNHIPFGVDDYDVLTDVNSALESEMQLMEDAPSMVDSEIAMEVGSSMQRSSSWKAFFCNVCQKRYSSKSSLLSHTRLHTGEQPYKCDECAITFAHKVELLNHSIDVHGKPIDGRIYSCEKCSFQSKSDYLWKRHLQTHSSARTVKCKHCGLYYKDKTGLKRHITVKHKGIRSTDISTIRSQHVGLPSEAPTIATNPPLSHMSEANIANRSLAVIIDCFGKRNSGVLPVLWIEEFDQTVIDTVRKQLNTYIVCISRLNLEDRTVRDCLSSMSDCDATVTRLANHGEEPIFMFMFRGGKFTNEFKGQKFQSYNQLSSLLGEFAKSTRVVPVNILQGNSGVWYPKLLTELKGPITILNTFEV